MSPSSPRPWRLVRRAGYLLAGLVGSAVFFRLPVLSSFDAIPGNIGDARFVLYTCEHWYRVFVGQASWRSPPILFPTPGVLGYSDALLGLGAPYALLRCVGVDGFRAYQVVVLALPFVGYVGALWLLRRVLGVGPIPAVLGALLFAFSSPMATSMAHAQLQTIAFVPYLALLLNAYCRALPARRQAAIGWGTAAAFLSALLAYTSFYTAWYCAFFASITGVLLVTVLVIHGRLRAVLAQARVLAKGWTAWAIPLAALGVFSLPFIATYLQSFRQFQRRPWVEEVVPGLPSPLDLVNVGWENFVWGGLLRRIGPELQLRPGFWELDKGIPPVLLLVFLAVTIHLLVAAPPAPRALPGDTAPSPFARRTAGLCAAGVLSCWLLMLAFGHRSLWWLVYRLFPGAGALRSVYRFNLVLVLPLVVVVSYGAEVALRHLRRGAGLARVAGLSLALLVGLLAVVEQFNGHRDVLSMTVERRALLGVPAPPPSCRTMAIVAQRDAFSGWWAPLQLEAMLISQRFGLSTVNGYSGWTPPDWDLHLAAAQDYRRRVQVWTMAHQVTGLCFYDVDARTWELPAGQGAGGASQ